MGKEGQKWCRPSRHFLEETQEYQEIFWYLNLGTSEYVKKVFPIRLHFLIVVVLYFLTLAAWWAWVIRQVFDPRKFISLEVRVFQNWRSVTCQKTCIFINNIPSCIYTVKVYWFTIEPWFFLWFGIHTDFLFYFCVDCRQWMLFRRFCSEYYSSNVFNDKMYLRKGIR
jgi:hypothetical protein